MPTFLKSKPILVATATFALILVAPLAFAQAPGGGEHGGAGPGRSGGAEMGGAEHGGERPTGAPGSENPGRASERAAPGAEHGGPATGRPAGNAEPGAPGAGERTEPNRSGETRGSPNADGAGRPGEANPERGDRHEGGHASLSGAQRAKFRGFIKEQHVEALHGVDFKIGRGTIIPAHYHFYPLTPALIELVPEYRGYDYIVVDDEIIILEPGTRRIVDVIED